MNLDSVVKYHFAKSTQINDSPRATASDTLTGTDVMAAMGMCQSRAPLGYSAFLGKMEISITEKKKAIQLLTQYGMKRCDKVAALRKLSSNIKVKVVQKLATFAYMDYCRSAASVVECPACKGKRFTSRKGKTVKSHYTMRLPDWAKELGQSPSDFDSKREIEDVHHDLCIKCDGKGVISTSCCKCNGRGEAVDRKESERQGVPVKRTCKQCSGRGYERLPAAEAYRAITIFTQGITPTVWDKAVKPFYEGLITELHKAEEEANRQLTKVTSNFEKS
ncbi:TPA: antitermination protein [Serratia marcescens]|uniref:antitermination protein n=1 Tax=Serratia marcescens TaxID=615 RepID=UPI000E0170DD|nr:antitermination protein [Serratia marcescens]SUI40367.1 Antitermination protein [Serratia marcescens]HEJ6970376.1 antitermination protein [Serratia marcescens]HEJ6977266.1 antitermination protein [Serratia marcescens]